LQWVWLYHCRIYIDLGCCDDQAGGARLRVLEMGEVYKHGLISDTNKLLQVMTGVGKTDESETRNGESS
jgi:hypothetical protein